MIQKYNNMYLYIVEYPLDILCSRYMRQKVSVEENIYLKYT